MERVNKQSNLQKSNQPQKISTPSLISGQKGVYIKPIPPLNSFIRSNGVIDLESRKVGKYSLTKFSIKTTSSHIQYLVLSYKLGKTKYKINSVKTIKIPNRKMEQESGVIEITQGFWNTRTFKLTDLPKKIIDSINENINKFNLEWNEKVEEDLIIKRKKIENSKDKFFDGLDV